MPFLSDGDFPSVLRCRRQCRTAYRASYFTVISFCVRRACIVSVAPDGDENSLRRTTVASNTRPSLDVGCRWCDYPLSPRSASWSPSVRRSILEISVEEWDKYRKYMGKHFLVRRNARAIRCFELHKIQKYNESGRTFWNDTDKTTQINWKLYVGYTSY